jgi:hypothetical protein
MEKEQELLFHQKVKIALDGRKNKWLVERSGIQSSEISRILNGRLIPTDRQIEKIRAAFPFNVNF